MKEAIQRFIEYMQEEKEAPMNTQVSYRRDLIKMMEYLKSIGVVKVSDVEKEDLEDYLFSMEEEGKSANTIRRSIAAMKNFYHFAERKGWTKISPAELLKPPKIEKKMPSILSVEEVDCLLSQATGIDSKEIRDAAVMELLYATGIRVTELINLTMDDVDLENNCITCEGRTKVRVIPFGSKAKEAIETYLKHARSELLDNNVMPYIFTNNVGEQLSRQVVWKMVKFYAKKAGIKQEIMPHTLRHSFAAHLLQNGADLKDVQEMLGHADITTTQLYLNWKTSNVRSSYKAHPRS